MYTFINKHFCASIAHLGTWRGKKPNLGLPQRLPLSLSHTMYSRSVTTKAFKERTYILAPGTELNIH